MPNWDRPAFDYCRDRFLMWPTLLFSMLAIINILAPKSSGDRMYGFKLAAYAVIAVLLAKDRLTVVLVGAGFVALRLGTALVFTRNWKAYGAGFLVALGIVVALIPVIRRWNPSYEDPRATNIPGVLFVVAGIVAAVAVVMILQP
jgi:hypothetical protein